MEIGFVAMGGSGVPYAAAPDWRFPPCHRNRQDRVGHHQRLCFPAGSIGVAGGAIAWHFAGFPGVRR
jgi:hypothetical protein